jgi:hypothetical protein
MSVVSDFADRSGNVIADRACTFASSLVEVVTNQTSADQKREQYLGWVVFRTLPPTYAGRRRAAPMTSADPTLITLQAPCGSLPQVKLDSPLGA